MRRRLGGGLGYDRLEFVQPSLLRAECGPQSCGPVGGWGRGGPVEDDVVQGPFGLDGFTLGCVCVVGVVDLDGDDAAAPGLLVQVGADAGERTGGDADVKQAFGAVEPVQGGAAGGVQAAFLVEQAAQELCVDVGHDAAFLGSGRVVAGAASTARRLSISSRSHVGVTEPLRPARQASGRISCKCSAAGLVATTGPWAGVRCGCPCVSAEHGLRPQPCLR